MSVDLQAVLLQTSDEKVYSAFIEVTEAPNRAFCNNNGIEYRSVIGVLRGFHPWQATFNRISLFSDYAQSGFSGWLLYLDADAFVADVHFDIRKYLASKRDIMLIASRGLNKGKWDVNAGVLFLNFGHPVTRVLVNEWQRSFNDQVSDDLLAATSRPWGFKPNDQDLLQDLLRLNLNEWNEYILIEPKEMLNSPNGTLIKQILRRDAETLEQRIELAKQAIAIAMQKQVQC